MRAADFTNRQARSRRYLAYALAVTMSAWLGVALWLVPLLIRLGHEGRGPALIRRMLSGRATVPLTEYLGAWSALWPRLTIVAAVLGVSTHLVVRHRTRVTERVAGWLTPRVPQPNSLLMLVGITLGLTLGVVEGAYVFGYRLIVGAQGDISRHVLWMAPLDNALLFGGLGSIAWLLARRWPGLIRAPLFTLMVSATGVYALLRALQILHLFAAVLLTLGCTVQLTRMVTWAGERASRSMRRLTLVLSVWTVLAAGGMMGLERWLEMRTLGSLPTLAAGPNILLLILDTVRAHNLSLYGYARPTTPNLERLATQSVVFTHAVSTSSWTLPAHASMFTGRFNYELHTDLHEPLDATHATLAEVLRDRGYQTAGFVANLSYAARESGLGRGFMHYEDQPVTIAAFAQNHWLLRRLAGYLRPRLGIHTSLVRKSAADINHAYLDWLDTRDSDRPFFAFLNYFDAHDPYEPPLTNLPAFAAPDARYWLTRDGWRGTPAQLNGLVDRYDDALRYLDDRVGALVRELERRGTLQNTILIIAADHGEQFGERKRNELTHGNTLYLSTLHVPLLIRYPEGAPADVRIDEWVSLRDLPATILDLAGMSGALPGTSLTAQWTVPGRAAHSPTLAELITPSQSTRDSLVSVIQEGWHYIRTANGSEELYRLQDDPWERTNLVKDQASADRLDRLRNRLNRSLAEARTTPRQVLKATARSKPETT